MDIQEMVESRIRELRADEEAHVVRRDDVSEPEREDRWERPSSQSSHQHKRRLSDRQSMPMPALSEFGDFVDEKLSQLALRMLEISERMSADYGRLEQDLLKSRLEVLQGAEEVLDLTLSLRKQCRNLLTQGEQEAGAGGKRAPSISGDTESLGSEDFDNRVSMHSMGVADLFRRT